MSKNTARTAAQKWTVNNMELIDKNALVKYLEGMGNEIYAGNDEYFIGQKAGLMKVVGVVMTFPAVEERKQGCWDGGGAYYCSNCNAYAATDVFGGRLDITEQHYCYNCGAKMDGKEGEE